MSDGGELRILRDYERGLRSALAGLPRPDVDDIVEEVHSHLAEEIADGRTPSEAVASFGEASAVAADIIARRLRPEDGPAVADAGRARRAFAWLGDFVIGWGPLVVVPVWLELIGWVQTNFMLSPEMIAELEAKYGFEPSPFPNGLLLLLALAFLLWGVWYWRGPRARSASVGMRMAGIAAFRVRGERLVVRTADVALGEPARIVARPKRYLAAPLAMLGLVVVFAAFYYTTMAIGSFTQPSAASIEAAARYEDFSRADTVLAAFYDAVVAGDVAGAQSLAEKPLAGRVAELVDRARRDGIKGADRGMNVGETSYVMNERYGDGKPARAVTLTLTRHDEQRDPGTFATVYRISAIEETATQ